MGFVVKGLLVFIVSLFLFLPFGHIPLCGYMLVLAILWGIVLYLYSDRHNVIFHQSFLAAAAGSLLAFCTVSIHSGAVAWLKGAPYSLLLFLILFSILTEEFRCSWQICKKNEEFREKNSNQSDQLFPEHVYDLERMKELLSLTPVLGVSSPWGNGKSFVVNALCATKEIRDAYYVIKIGVLSYKYNEFDRIIIRKLDDLLRANHIFSFYSTEALQVLGNHFWGRLVYHFFRGSQPGTATAIEGLKRELAYLDKGVLLVFEDIERAGDAEAVKKLLAFSERLAGEKTRVIYEYDADRLEQNLDISRDYLEKYIPLEMDLTHLSYQTMVSYIWKDMRMQPFDMKISDSSSPSGTLEEMIRNLLLPVDYYFMGLVFPRQLEIKEEVLSVRRVGEFLNGIRSWAQRYGGHEVDGVTAKVVVTFFFLKNFMVPEYKRLKPSRKLEETFLFNDVTEEVDIFHLCKKIWNEVPVPDRKAPVTAEMGKYRCPSFDARLEEVLEREDNLVSREVLSLFGYEVSDFRLQAWYEHTKETMLTEDSLRFRIAGEKRERINRIIWNLLQNGSSEYTNAHMAVVKFMKEVLGAPKDSWARVWKTYNEELFHEKIYKDNGTINHLFRIPLVDLADAFCRDSHPSEIWMKFIEFIEWAWGKRPIDSDFIQICNFLSVNGLIEPRVYLKMLELFSSLPVKGNLNSYEPYIRFLDTYVTRISYWGYGPHNFDHLLDLDSNHFNSDDGIHDVIQVLEDVKGHLCSDLLQTPEYQMDMETIRSFLHKNEDIIRTQEALKIRKPHISVSHIGTEYPHQPVMDKIRAMMAGVPFTESREKEIIERMGELYRNYKIIPGEIQVIKREMDKWKSENKK